MVLFVPETRYDRSSLESETPSTSTSSERVGSGSDNETEKIASGHTRETREDSASQVNKSYFQQLSLWSGVADTNIVKLFLRPFPMIVYPAVAFSFLGYA